MHAAAAAKAALDRGRRMPTMFKAWLGWPIVAILASLFAVYLGAGVLIAFLSNDIWDRNKQAEHVVFTESDTLIALYRLSAAS
jgi:hypothetical protein